MKSRERKPPARKNGAATVERVSGLVARALRRGQTVEIDGLGTFEPGSDGGPLFTPQAAAQVFVAYAVEISA